MIDYERRPAQYRGTIEVYPAERPYNWQYGDPEIPEWRWRCKSRNGQILAQGEGYRRRSGALNAIDAQYSARLTDEAAWSPGAQALVVPWRLVVRDRHGAITTTGAVY
ncbi:hypothetical protein SEA_BEARBQ_73 [Gordonia phage BearBQ]|nr:hypothetical protein SEA_BEARBQ_73 [Gordonia phage BearBQ]